MKNKECYGVKVLYKIFLFFFKLSDMLYIVVYGNILVIGIGLVIGLMLNFLVLVILLMNRCLLKNFIDIRVLICVLGIYLRIFVFV